MNIVIILGSRNPEGQTASAVGAFEKGAVSAGAAVEKVFLPQLTIERCRQCDEKGWGTCRTAGECVIKDDMETVRDKMNKADLAVFATPVYYSDLSESMRALLDRVRRVSTHGDRPNALKGKRAMGICVAGGGGGGAPNCCFKLEYILSTIGFDVLDMVPARRQNLELKKEVLEKAGSWYSRQ